MNKTGISGKLKVIFGNSFVISFMSIWLLIGFATDFRNEEYGDIVRAVQKHHFNGSCNVAIDVVTEWPFGWSPSGMNITIEKEALVVYTSTSKFLKADRIETDSGDLYYLYRWSEKENNQLIASYLELEVGRAGSLKWLKVGNCAIPEGKNYSDYKNKKCESFYETAIMCS